METFLETYKLPRLNQEETENLNRSITSRKKFKNGKILETYKIPRLNQEEIENLNKSITSWEIESVIKNLPKKRRSQDQMVSLVNSTKI